MELLRLGPPGAETPALRAAGKTYDLSPVAGDIDPDFFAAGGIGKARDAHREGRLRELSGAADLRVGVPVARPGAVLCIGQNYAAHAAESGSEPPREPILFFKHPSCLVGAYDDVVLPPGSVQADWEAELVVVIGRQADRLASPADAPAVIAGYTIGNDVSERAWQLGKDGGQWSQGKCFPTFGPLGPSVAIGPVDPTGLGIRSRINGEARQDSVTKDMIFAVDHLVWYLSQAMTLRPGDLVFTGTPEGVALSGRFPYLRAGDVIEIEIDGLGRQRQRVTAG
ncbi:fumarylacetoacetate hydrolase family protein [Actinomadura sp. NAK00032]|uniref:fumarylacetoacetate hydrolase family protein n=1 Tax=Actinomadura sp. NAK00032 TaxID=2742128 RepID=UPI0015928A58|nr:fumarylacetoacetate hydrolase family protein [Actinomadura sp. NAK00032]QKW36874.1 fumarylacetoacetate hydrolase family protein [Actinomadura sp. NAK00032]